MIKNFFITVYRNIMRNKFYSALNIVGLSVGLTCAILIALFLRDELSYDKYNVNYKRIIRYGNEFAAEGKIFRFAPSALPTGPTMKEEFPEVEEFVRFRPVRSTQKFKYGEKEFSEDNLAYADSTLFKIFTFEFIQGNPDKALTQPYTIVLSQKLAHKYFGNENPLNKVILSEENQPYTVTGVFKNLPKNTHYRCEAFYSMKTMEQQIGSERFNSVSPQEFGRLGFYTYLLLNEKSSVADIENKFSGYHEKYLSGFTGEENSPVFQYLEDIHMHSDLDWDAPVGNMKYIYILLAVAVFILLIASINYMNIATARSAKRAKEVGIRKAVGASRGKIIKQFLSESTILVFLSLTISVIAVELLLPQFNNLVNKELTLNLIHTPGLFLFLIGLAIIIGLLAGGYPAFYLSSFFPVTILKGIYRQERTTGFFRRLLVIFQFTVAAIMISGTLVVVSQLFYLQNKEMGFKKDNIIIAPIKDPLLSARMDAFKQELLTNPNVKKVATSSKSLGTTGGTGRGYYYQGETGMEQLLIYMMWVDFDYLDLMEMQAAQGRKFSRNFLGDTINSIMINETAAQKFGWGKNAIGKRMQSGIEQEGEDNSNIQRREVVGVLSDFHYQPASIPIEPTAIFVAENPASAPENVSHAHIIYMEINGQNQKSTIKFIEDTWNEFSPNYGFEYDFLADKLKENYAPEERLSRIFILFTVLSIFIAALGLFGLSLFMAEQRTKELGVRKVLGATVTTLVKMLTNDFLKLVIIANIIAIPVSYWAMEQWLVDFPYHISIGIWIYLVTLIISLLIALVTVAWQSARAANGNPVVALKYE